MSTIEVVGKTASQNSTKERLDKTASRKWEQSKDSTKWKPLRETIINHHPLMRHYSLFEDDVSSFGLFLLKGHLHAAEGLVIRRVISVPAS